MCHFYFRSFLTYCIGFYVCSPQSISLLIENEWVFVTFLILYSSIYSFILCLLNRSIFQDRISYIILLIFNILILLIPYFLILISIIYFQLSPYKMCIFLFCLFNPPTSFTHNPSYQSTIISFPHIISVYLYLIIINEASIEPYLPDEIMIIEIAN